MTRSICHGCGPQAPPCILETTGLDVTDLRCVVRDDDEKIQADWKLETEQEPDEDELFNDEYSPTRQELDEYGAP